MDRKLKSPPKTLQAPKSKDVQSKNTSPYGNVASKYQLRNLYVSLQRLPSSDVDKWKNSDQFSNTTVEINIAQDSKNDNKPMVRNRKSNNTNMKKISDENKLENLDDSCKTSETKQNITDTPTKQLPHSTEQDEQFLSVSRRSSLRNSSSNLVTKNVLPSTSKTETLKDDANVNISFSSPQLTNENKNLLETNLSPTKVNRIKIEEHKLSVTVSSSNNSSQKNKSKEIENNSENIVRQLRSKTINKIEENTLSTTKKLKTSNIESISTPESVNKLKRNLDEDDNSLEQKIILKKVKKINESEDTLEKSGVISSETSNPNNSFELKSSRKIKSKLAKNISASASDTLNKSNNDLQKEKRKISKEPDLSEEEPRLLRSSTIKQTLSYDIKMEDKKSTTGDNPKSPTSIDQNKSTTKTSVDKDKVTTVNVSDDRKKSKQSSDTDSIEPRILRSSSIKQVPSPSKEDKSKNSGISFNDSPQSPPLTEQLGSLSANKVVLLKEISSKKLPVKSSTIRDPRKINKIIENPTIDKEIGNEMKQSTLLSPVTKTNLNQISDNLTTNLENKDLEESTKVKKSNTSKFKESSSDSKIALVSENETLPLKKEISLFETPMISKNIRTYSRKGKRKYKIFNQIEIKDSPNVDSESSITETSLESVEIEKSPINILNPIGDTEPSFSLKAADDSCSSEEKISTALSTPSSQEKPPKSSGIPVNVKTLRTRKSDSLKLTTGSLTNIKHKSIRSDKKSIDLSTFIQMSKMNRILSEMFHSSNFKDVSKNIGDSHKKLLSLTNSSNSSLSSSSESTVIIPEENSSRNSKDISEITATPKTKKLRKYSLNNSYDDKKSVHSLSTNITIDEKNESPGSDKNDLINSKSSLSSANLASKSQSPLVEVCPEKEEILLNNTNEVSKSLSTASKNLTKQKAPKKRKNSLPSTKLLCPGELTKIDDKTSSEISTSEISSKKDQSIIENDTSVSTSDKVSETPPVKVTNNDLVEMIDSKKDISLATKKLSTPKRSLKQESPSDKSNELVLPTQSSVNVLIENKVNSKKVFSVPVKKLSTPRQLSKRAINKKTASNKSSELLKLPPQTIVKDLTDEEVNTKKDVTLLAKQLQPSRQLLKRAVKKETPSNVSGDIPKSTPSGNLTKEKVVSEKVTTLPSKSLPQKQLSKNNEIFEKEGTPLNISSEISKSPPSQTTNSSIIAENVALKEDSTAPSRRLSKEQLSTSNESFVVEETLSNTSSEISKSPPSQITNSSIITENVALKEDIASPSRTLSKGQLSTNNESFEKEGNPLNISSEISKSPPSQTTNISIKKENVTLKKRTSSPPKKLLKKQISTLKEETPENVENQISQQLPIQTTNISVKNENVTLKKGICLPPKKLPKKQMSKNNEITVKEETPLIPASEITKTPPSQTTNSDVIKDDVNLKKDVSSPPKKVPKTQMTKTKEVEVKEETPLNPASEISKLPPSQTTNSDVIKDDVNLKKDVSSPPKKVPKTQMTKTKEVEVKEETPLNPASEISKLPSSQTTKSDVIKDDVTLKKDVSSPSRKVAKRQMTKTKEVAVKKETPSNISSEISKSPPSQTANISIIKEEVISSPPKKIPKRQISKTKGVAVKEETPPNTPSEISKSPPSQTANISIIKEEVISSPPKKISKRQISKTKGVAVKEETPPNTPSEISKSPPSQSTTSDLIEENVTEKKDISSPPKKIPKTQMTKTDDVAVKKETPSNTPRKITKLPSSQTANTDIIKGNIPLKKDTSLPSKTLSKKQLRKNNEIAIKEEISSNSSSEISKLPLSQDASNVLMKEEVDTKKDNALPSKILPKRKLSKNNDSVVKVQTSSTASSEISKLSPAQKSSNDIIKENVAVKKETFSLSKILPRKLSPRRKLSKSCVQQVKEETSSNTLSEISKLPLTAAESAECDLIKEEIDLQKNTSAGSKKLSPRKIIAIEENTSNASTNECSTLPPSQVANSDLKKKKVKSKKRPSVPRKKLSPSKIVAIEKPSSEISTLPPSQAASSDLMEEEDDPSLSADKLPFREIVVIEEPPTDTSNESSTLPPTGVASCDLMKEETSSDEDPSLSSEKTPFREIVVIEEPPTDTSNESSTLPPTGVDSCDLMKDQDPCLLSEKVPFREIIIIDEPPSNDVSKLPPTQTPNSDLNKEKHDSKENSSSSSEKISPEEIVVIEEPPTDSSNEIPADVNDLKKEKIVSKKDTSLPPEKLLPSKTDQDILNQVSISESSQTGHNVSMKHEDNSKEVISLKMDSTLKEETFKSTEKLSNIAKKEESFSNTVNQISILKPSEVADKVLLKTNLKEDSASSTVNEPSNDVSPLKEDSSNKVSKLQSSQKEIKNVVKKNIGLVKNDSLLSKKLSSPKRPIKTEKSTINKEISSDSSIKISETISTQVPNSSNLLKLQQASLPSKNIPRGSNEISSNQAPNKDFIKQNLHSNKVTTLETTSKMSKNEGNFLKEEKCLPKSNKNLPSPQASSNDLIRQTNNSASIKKLSSPSQMSKIIKRDVNVVNSSKKITKLPSSQMSRNELMKNIISITGDTSLPSRNLSQSQLSRMYRAALFKQISNFKFKRSVSTQTERNTNNDNESNKRFKASVKINRDLLEKANLVSCSSNSQSQVKKRKFNEGRRSLPLSTSLPSINQSLNSKIIFRKAKFPNSSLVSCSSNGQPLNKKRKLNQGRSILPLSTEQTTKEVNCNLLQKSNVPNSSLVVHSFNGQLLQRKRKIDQDKNLPTTKLHKPSSVIEINERKKTNMIKNIISPKVLHGSVIKKKSSSKSPVKICSSCNRASYNSPSLLSTTDFLKEYYRSLTQDSSSPSTSKPSAEQDNTSEITNKITEKSNNDKTSLPKNPSSENADIEVSNKPKNEKPSRKQLIIDNLKNIKNNQPTMVIELVSHSFYKNAISSSNASLQINKTINQVEHLSVNTTIIKTEQINPTDHVFKIPTKAPPKAKNKVITKSETFLRPKANELEVGSLVRTSYGLAIKSGRTIIIPKELPEGLRFNLINGLNEIYFRRKYIYDPNKSENISESEKIENEKFEKDYLEFKNKHEKSISPYDQLYAEYLYSDEDNVSHSDKKEALKLIKKYDPNFDKLNKQDFHKYRKAHMEFIRLFDNEGHITPFTSDIAMSHLISTHQRVKSLKGKLKNKSAKSNNAEELVIIKKSFDSNPTAKEILRISGHDSYCTVFPPPPYYELMKRGKPFCPKSYFKALQRKKTKLSNMPNNQIEIENNPNNIKTNEIGTPMKHNFNLLNKNQSSYKELLSSRINRVINDHKNILESKKIPKRNENILLNYANTLDMSSDNFTNDVRFQYNLRSDGKSKNISSKLKSDQFNRRLKESIDNDSDTDEDETVSDENIHSNIEENIKRSSEMNKLAKLLHIEEHISEYKKLDQSISNAAKSCKNSINIEQLNKDLRIMVPKEGYGKELPERPTEWFLKFVTKFRKLELWRLHNLFKAQDHFRRIESAKLNVLEKIYEKLSENDVLNDERQN